MNKPEDVERLLVDLSAKDGTPHQICLDKELRPILTDLVKLGPGNEKHPSVIQLFNWLVDPHHTGEEFTYVIGPLAKNVYNLVHCPYLGKVAAEALAVRCPVLAGFWEQAVWLLISLNSSYSKDVYGAASDQLSFWIIYVIGDPDICPNPYLRYELMILILIMVNFNTYNLEHGFESVISAFSSLKLYNIDYLSEMSVWEFHRMGFYEITQILEKLAEDDHLRFFGDLLSEALLQGKDANLSVLLHDVACNSAINSNRHRKPRTISFLSFDVAVNSAVNPNRYREPRTLQGLTALVVTIAEYAKLHHKIFQNEDFNWQSMLSSTEAISHTLFVLISNFGASCRTPQVVGLTASCIMDVMDLVISVNAYFLQYMDDIEAVINSLQTSCTNLNQVLIILKEDGPFPVIGSAVGLAIIHKNYDRLDALRSIFSEYKIFQFFSEITSLVQYAKYMQPYDDMPSLVTANTH
ncbi:unnamed protein product [Meganyctiphanes norvegica]|uniref:Uncharacterized protein n=1 Tax=Meganyctiphanes norvegica TaxID=48144 RepID=A0AAV2QHE6_MEGNR